MINFIKNITAKNKSKKENDYDIIKPPIYKEGGHDNFTKKEAQIYFEWFVSEIPHRLEVLQEYISRDNPDLKLDFSEESLVPLWEWVSGKIETRKLSKEEIYEKDKDLPEWLKAESKDWTFTLRTFAIALDVGIYLFEILRKYDERIKWTVKIKSKRYIFYNMPIIYNGAGIESEPKNLIEVAMMRELRSKDKNRLVQLLEVRLKTIGIKR